MSYHQEDMRPRVEMVPKKPSAAHFLWSHATDFIWWLIVAWFIAILTEWGGMFLFWKEAGAQHSQDMLVTELGYIQDDVKLRYVGGATPSGFARGFASKLDYYLFEWTHIRDFLTWAISIPDSASQGLLFIRNTVIVCRDYIAAAINTTQIFAVRLAVAFMSLPLFLLVGTAALLDGMVERELRRYGGAMESAFMYHNVKPWSKPIIFGAFVLYLGFPIEIHPNVVLVPFVIGFGVIVYITAKTFKKFI